MSTWMLLGEIGELQNRHGRPIGTKGVGKDTLADMITDLLPRHVRVVRLSFAKYLKGSVCGCYGIDRSFYDTAERKEIPIEGLEGWTFRRLLEELGTKVAREGLPIPELTFNSAETWVKKLSVDIFKTGLNPLERLAAEIFDICDHELLLPAEEIIPRLGVTLSTLVKSLKDRMRERGLPEVPDTIPPTLVIITDVRMPNEYRFVKEMLGGGIIKVVRRRDDMEDEPKDEPEDEPKDQPVSNVVDPNMIPDIVVENHGTLDQLREQALRIVSLTPFAPKPF